MTQGEAARALRDERAAFEKRELQLQVRGGTLEQERCLFVPANAGTLLQEEA